MRLPGGGDHETARGRGPLTDGVAALDGVGGVVQRGEAGVWPAALELDEQCLLGGAGEVSRALEGPVGTAHTLLLLGEKKGPVSTEQRSLSVLNRGSRQY